LKYQTIKTRRTKNKEQNLNNAETRQLNTADGSTNFHRRNEYPELMEQSWGKNQTYGIETNTNAWHVNGKFANKHGIEMYDIIGWRSLNGCRRLQINAVKDMKGQILKITEELKLDN
jgi:hypothetical protein